jgi:acetolactate decarboxylase
VVAQKNSILHVPTQFGTVNNLLINQELYGKFKYGDIIKKGNFGVGTFNGLDGEMVAVDGQFYQIDTKLNARIVRNNQETPIAKVINFPEKVDIQETCREISSIEKLIKYLHRFIQKDSYFACRIDGAFDSILARSHSKIKKPYQKISVKESRPLGEHLRLFSELYPDDIATLLNINGTMVGFYTPESVNRDIDLPGWHFHFIADGEKFKRGGHVLDCFVKDAKINLLQVEPPRLAFRSGPH